MASKEPSVPSQSEIDTALETLYAAGLPIRAAVTGAAHVARSNTNVSPFSKPIQDLATQIGWGAIWSRPGLSRQQRSLIGVAMLTALGKSQELGVHVKGAVRNGCTVLEVREAVLHASVYAGLPTGLEGFRVAERALEELMGREELDRAVKAKL
ncbi:hypothetical protein MBLNU230_g5087t1 [Neophaeotheca triangularis]